MWSQPRERSPRPSTPAMRVSCRRLQGAPDEIEEVTAWRKGSLALSNRTLKDGIAALRRWYGYDVRVADVTLLKRPVTVKASLDSAMQAVQQVARSAGLRFGYVGENMAFVDTADRKTRLR